MDRITELALASTYVYSRDSVNRVGIPVGWQVAEVASGQDAYVKDDSVGFSAGAFLDASGNIVIAFTGTNEFADWVTGNVPGALGVRSPQVEHALAFVSDVLARYEGEGKSVTFTGHSLGGGLASLMAVFFAKDAHTFDPAPFQASALVPGTILSYFSFYEAYQDKLNRSSDPAFAAYLVNPIARLAERQADVGATALSGETLSLLRSQWTGIYSSVDLVDVTASSLSQLANALPSAELLALLPLVPATATDLAKAAFSAATALHSIDLLTLLHGSPSLLQAAQQTPKLLELISAEIVQGKRTVLEYLVSPVQRISSEAGRER